MPAQPEGVRRALPSHARHVYMAAYREALREQEELEQGAMPNPEEADRIAWEAVRKKYQQQMHEWFPEGQA